MSYNLRMWYRHIPPVVLLAFLSAAQGAAITLDPEPGYEEFHGEAAVRPSGGALLTWTRQQEPGGAWTAMAATLDPNSSQLGEIHEWGAGGSEQVVPLGTGYLAVRLQVENSPEWFVQRLDDSGRPVGVALPLGFIVSAVAHPTPGGGAVVVAAGVTGTGGATKAWRFGPDGALLFEAVSLADNSLDAAVGADAAGNLVLVWTDSGIRVFARRFSPDLQPLGPVIPVALGGARGIRVAVAPDGRFLVVFAQSYQLWARAYRANGSPASSRRRFSPPADTVMQEVFDVALGADGRVLVVWKTYENSNVPVIRARALSLAGRTLTKVFRLAQIKGGRGELLRPRAESLPGGDFLILWSRVEADGETVTLQSRRFAGR